MVSALYTFRQRCKPIRSLEIIVPSSPLPGLQLHCFHFLAKFQMNSKNKLTKQNAAKSSNAF